MQTVGLNDREIAAKILRTVRTRPEGKNVVTVDVMSFGDIEDADWVAKVTLRDGSQRPKDLDRAMIAITYDLRRRYHLMTDA